MTKTTTTPTTTTTTTTPPKVHQARVRALPGVHGQDAVLVLRQGGHQGSAGANTVTGC